MVRETLSQSASLETIYWFQNQGGNTPASTTLHPAFNSLINAGDLFLDIGCGYGRVSSQLGSLGVRVIGIDPNLSELLIGKMRSPSIGFTLGYGEQLPFSGDTFDGAIMLGLLGAVNKCVRQRILRETVRTIKPRGLIYVAEFVQITDFEQRTFRDQKRWVDVYMQDQDTTGEYGSVVVYRKDGSTYFIAHHFTVSELHVLLEEAGVNILDTKKVPVVSNVSSQIRETFNVWGRKD